MFKNAIRDARPDALENACQFLRTIMKDMQYNQVDDVTYTVVQLTIEEKKNDYYMARVQTPLRIDYGEPQPTRLSAKQSAAYAAVLYMCRAKQFGRNFIAASVELQNEAKPPRRSNSVCEDGERKRAYTTGAANKQHSQLAKNIYAEEEAKKEDLPKIVLSLNTKSRDELDYRSETNSVNNESEQRLERSTSLESGKFIEEVNWARKQKKRRDTGKAYF